MSEQESKQGEESVFDAIVAKLEIADKYGINRDQIPEHVEDFHLILLYTLAQLKREPGEDLDWKDPFVIEEESFAIAQAPSNGTLDSTLNVQGEKCYDIEILGNNYRLNVDAGSLIRLDKTEISEEEELEIFKFVLAQMPEEGLNLYENSLNKIFKNYPPISDCLKSFSKTPHSSSSVSQNE